MKEPKQKNNEEKKKSEKKRGKLQSWEISVATEKKTVA